MLQSEKVAIAAHLHVLLRRKTGRVTDIEWMAANEAYATEIVRFARASAQQDGHTDLADWAAKLEAALSLKNQKTGAHPADRMTQSPPSAPVPEAARYVRGIR
jgi:hypothetical protein